MPPPATLESPPGLVLFDLDGTLADTFPDLHRALDRALLEHGLGPADATAVRDVVSAGGRAMTRAALAASNPPRSADETLVAAVLERFLAIYERDIAVHTRLFDGMQALLERLQSAGCATGVVTNKHSRFATPLLERLALDPAPGCLVCGDTAARAKPHPDSLLHAADRLGVAPARCAYLGDARNDVRAARAAGMPVAVAAWGYLAPGDRPQAWQADAVLARPGDVPGWLGLAG